MRRHFLSLKLPEQLAQMTAPKPTWRQRWANKLHRSGGSKLPNWHTDMAKLHGGIKVGLISIARQERRQVATCMGLLEAGSGVDDAVRCHPLIATHPGIASVVKAAEEEAAAATAGAAAVPGPAGSEAGAGFCPVERRLHQLLSELLGQMDAELEALRTSR
jgi:hypothetical protein